MSLIARMLLIVFLAMPILEPAQEPKAFALPDERYKVDMLLVVAHPDDEGAATPYLARALDEHKRVAVVFGTRGRSGANEAGAEQAGALGAIREIEARNALATLGITNVWFLAGKDTASQNVLQSLANWDHGVSLEQLVRLVRLTRPEVMLTFLPGTFIGEEHGDHHASGVLATDAFDLSGRSQCTSCSANRWSAAALQEIFSMASRRVPFPSSGLMFLRNLHGRNYRWRSAAHTVSTRSFDTRTGSPISPIQSRRRSRCKGIPPWRFLCGCGIERGRHRKYCSPPRFLRTGPCRTAQGNSSWRQNRW